MRLASSVLCLLLASHFSFGQPTQKLNQNNLHILIKDSATVTNALSGVFDNPAVEVGLNKKFKPITNSHYPIRVAIDPGHIACGKKEAIIEQRYINTPSGFFYESELTMATALILKKLLVARGFDVMISREDDKTALGMTYSRWFKKNFKTQLKTDFELGKISADRYRFLQHADKTTVFHQYFKDIDFLARGANINAFQPDVTVVIHYNATEFNNRPDIYAPAVDYNYSVAFVPGGFTTQELQLQGQFDDFIRLASSDVVGKSVQLSRFIVDEFDKKLHSPPLLPKDLPDLWYLKKYSTYTGTPGIYGRNLYLTRAIQSPVCYGECLLQNNKAEIGLLSKKDLKIGKHKVPSRISDVADCYYTGIIKYFMDNGWLAKDK